jgi:XTP/dITP diphosphohydrolase
MQRIILASNNRGKLSEIRRMLEPMGLDAVAQSDLDIPQAAEPHCTFVENALAKARHASRMGKLPALADDSGICVEALDGAPGVYSALYAGEPKSDQRNNEKLLEALHNITNRRAHYRCVMVLVQHALDPEPLIAEGVWWGEILASPRGSNGFGYDPLFLIPELDKSGAEISLDVKNSISHRGKALRALVEKLKEARFTP